MRIKLLLILFTTLSVVFLGCKNIAKAASYDLKAESLTMNSAKCEVNQVCSFTARVKNLGDDFTLNFPLKSTVSADGYKADSPTTILPAQNTVIKTNDYITFSIYGLFSRLGAINLAFSFSLTGYIAESDTGNNSTSIIVNVTGHDLAVEAINISPKSPRSGQNCFIQIKVKNNGTYNLYAESGLNIIRSFTDFSLSEASSTIPSFSHVIHPGDYLYWGYTGSFSSGGEKQLSFTVDPDDVLHESNTANNAVVEKITVYSAADTDLAIDSVSFSADEIILGAPLDITIGVKNIGKTFLTDAAGLAEASLNFRLPNFDYGISDLVLDAYPTMSLPLNPTSIFHYKFHGAFNQPGDINLSFALNKDQQLIEANYDNDATTTAVTVYKSQALADDFSILSKSLSLVSSTTAIIGWTTDLKTTGVLNYNQTPYLVSDNKIVDSNNALSHSLTFNNFKPGVNYSYMITANNGSAQKLDMLNSFFMPVDDRLIIASGPSVLLSGQTATTTWNTNLISSSYVYSRKVGTSSPSLAGSGTMVSKHEVVLNNLAYGQYEYFITSTSTPGTNVRTDWAGFVILAAPTSTPAVVVPGAGNNAAVLATTASYAATDNGLYAKLKGKIILKVEGKGEAYYISPKEKKIYYLSRPADAFQVVRGQGVGITNSDLAKIPLGLSSLSGLDSDNDGLPDAFEQAISTDKNKADTDGDGFNDKAELTSGFSPSAKNKKLNYGQAFAAKQKGKILLQVQGRGEAWYVNPADGKRYFLARPADAFNLMRQLGVGVTNNNYATLGGK